MQIVHEVNAPDQIFIRVVEAGSLRAVAEEMGVDPSSVSRKVSALEDRLQAKLLRRSTKRSVPTEAGLRYYEGVRRLLDERAALEADVAGLIDEPRGRLRIGAPVDFGARFVAPVIADLMRDAPDLDVELVLGSGFDDLTQGGLDAVVRIGTLTDSSLVARKVAVVPRVIVGAASYFEKHGMPSTPADLSGHPFVFYRGGQRRLVLDLQSNGRKKRAEVTGRVAANSVTAIRQLVLGGAGLHHGPLWALEEDIAVGRVRIALPDWHTPAFPVHVVRLASSYVPAKVREFSDRFAAAMAQEDTLR
ncbi:LysR family transcriptional regulator [Erythrobacter rubeus]|uniref:LysR family transcriptional regulator n=1 Tax=Erythrobacter rubeus TaxID=2760803 RepID=A0ABR8KWG6_9SPHN|nr:LysR family transcriptional regulator [Erythrobacter rubeus]MBD2842562.1 LysR family transcriptional regulator [Erythrobacter rubeus]